MKALSYKSTKLISAFFDRGGACGDDDTTQVPAVDGDIVDVLFAD